jgi:hypothetical protein
MAGLLYSITEITAYQLQGTFILHADDNGVIGRHTVITSEHFSSTTTDRCLWVEVRAQRYGAYNHEMGVHFAGTPAHDAFTCIITEQAFSVTRSETTVFSEIFPQPETY